MDDSNGNSSSSNNSSHLYPHLQTPPPSSHYRAAAATHMPFPSYYLPPPAAAGGGSLDPAAFVHGAERPLDLDFDSQDCESEDGIGALEEPPKSGPARGSGSKRSRAAEVHNLSEKRRRSRINEKMKALQNLIPNSNKTDKASMLDEAIEYLKQLQLQVQMLSMRNGLNLQPMYMPGALQGMQSSQLCLGFGVDNGSAVNMGVGLLPLNLESSPANSYSLLNRDASSHQPSILPSFTAPGASFRIDRSHSHHGSFQLPVAAEHLRTEDVERQEQLDSGRSISNLRDNEMKTMAVAASMHFGGQTSSLGDAQQLGRGVLTGERSEDVLSKDPDNQMFIQHFHGLHTGSSFPPSDVKPGSP